MIALATVTETMPDWLQIVLYLVAAVAGGGALHGGRRLVVSFRRDDQTSGPQPDPGQDEDMVSEDQCRIYRNSVGRSLDDIKAMLKVIAPAVSEMQGELRGVKDNVRMLIRRGLD